MERHLLYRILSFGAAVALLVGAVAPVSAAVWTEQPDYSPGSIVTISGDDSDGAGYLAGETVHVDVTGPNGYASSCDATVDDTGAWSCQVTLWGSDLAAGDYTYTATGQTSGVTQTGSFTDQVAFALDAATFTWFDATDAAAGFDVTVSGTYRCDSSSPSGNNCSSATVAIGIYPSDGSNNSVAGGTIANKNLALGTAAAGTAWSWTFQFRPVPGAGQWPIPADGKFDVKAAFTFSPGSNGSTPNNKYNDNAWGLDTTLPTSAIDTVVAGAMPTADGTATDPGSASPVPHFSGFDNSDSPKPMHVEIHTDPGDVLVTGSGLDLALNNLGSTKQTGDWSYDYADTGNDPLPDGGYCFVAWATDHAGNVQDPVTTSCFTLGTPAAEIPTVTTEIHDATHADVTGTQVNLGSVLHDSASVTTTTNNVPSGSSFDFELWTGSDCNAGSDDTQVGTTENVAVGDGTSLTETEESSDTDPLHAGFYSFKVSFNSGDTDTVADGEAACEVVEVLKADTTITTDIGPWVQGSVIDNATVDTDGYDGFNLGGTGVVVTFTLYGTTDCTGSPIDEQDADFSAGGTPPDSVDSPDFGPLDPGYYCFTAQYQGNDDYDASPVSDIEPFTVVPAVELKRGECTFDVDPNRDGEQFRLIYTPEMGTAYSKLNASNPGQMFLDVFYIGDGNEDITVDIPFPFITTGAMPVHFYDGVTISSPEEGVFCYTPGADLGPSDDMVTLASYGGGATFGDSYSLSIHVPDNAAGSGLVDVRIHLDYGLKWVATECSKTSTTWPIDAHCSNYDIPDDQAYEFGAFGGTDSIMSENAFKKDPGIGGLVTKASTDPLAGATVEIWQGTKLWQTVHTDEDGWYMAAFKYTGKAVTFTVKLVDYGVQRSITLKSNGFAIVNFSGL